ncbi:MAG TPA: hybrid sensor histidine kinase/response regulator, partial [Coleofasciculaceae cyanobacterium]
MSRLNPYYWRSLLPPHHPERLPTWTPIVLGMAAGLMGLGALAGMPVHLFVPILAACLLLLPLSPWIVVLLGILGAGVMIGSGGSLRQVAVLEIVVALSPWMRRRLLQQEWQWAAQRLLASLIQAETAQSPEQSIALALTCLKESACADAAIVLRQVDRVTAEVMSSIPETALSHRLTTPALFAEAIAQDRCLYYLDYPTSSNAASVLLTQGVKTLAVVPLHQLPLQGAILLLWYDSVPLSAPLQQWLESLRRGLSHLLRFQDTTLRLEKLQSRFVAML